MREIVRGDGHRQRAASRRKLLGTLKVLELVAPENLGASRASSSTSFEGWRVTQPAIDFIDATEAARRGVLPISRSRSRRRTASSPYAGARPKSTWRWCTCHISNNTDFDYLGREPNVRVRFVRSVDQLGAPDAVSSSRGRELMGTFFTCGASASTRLASERQRQHAHRRHLRWVQMLGRELLDESRRESEHGSTTGLGLLDIDVEFLLGGGEYQSPVRSDGDDPFASAGGVGVRFAGLVRYASARPLYTAIEAGATKPRAIHRTGTIAIYSEPATESCVHRPAAPAQGIARADGALVQSRHSRRESYNRLAAALAEHLTIPDAAPSRRGALPAGGGST